MQSHAFSSHKPKRITKSNVTAIVMDWILRSLSKIF